MLRSDGLNSRSEKIGPAIFISTDTLTEVRECRKCGAAKPLCDFKKCATARKGRCNTCKRCDADRLRQRLIKHRDEINAGRRARRARNPEHFRAQARARIDRRRDRVRSQNALAVQRYKERYPEKVAARRAVQRAIANADFIKPDVCQAKSCECRTGLIAHHSSYDGHRRLDVDWLCREHHERVHHNGPVELKAGGSRKFARAPGHDIALSKRPQINPRARSAPLAT